MINPSLDKIEVAERIKQRRAALNLSQRQLGEMVYGNGSYASLQQKIKRFESGKQLPKDPGEWDALAKNLNTTVRYLQFGEVFESDSELNKAEKLQKELDLMTQRYERLIDRYEKIIENQDRRIESLLNYITNIEVGKEQHLPL